MKKSYLLVALCLLLALSPLTAMAETMYVVTPNGGGVNMREGPSTDYDVVTSVGFGEAVELLDMMPGSSWATVNYNGYYGYILIRYLSDYIPPVPAPTYWPTYQPYPTPRPTSRPNPKPNPKPNDGSLERTLSNMFAGFVSNKYDVIVVPSTPTTYVNLRWAPSKSAPVRSQYWAGTSLQVLSQNGEWSEVYDPQTGMHGFMMTSFLTPGGVGMSAGGGG